MLHTRRAVLIAAPAVALAWAAVMVMVPGGAGAQAAERFFSAIADLPVMPGLVEVADARMVFDKPGGRIVQVAASGVVSRDDVLRFYTGVLPRLGWTRAADGAFRREGERLSLRMRTGDGALTVQFSLSPE
jgi:hypothetical protein